MSEYSIDENRLANIDEKIQLPADLLPLYEKKKRQAIIGSFETIQRQFHTQMITEGWSSFASALRSSGAIVATRYGLSMVNTDVIPDDLAPYVLEHEVVENTLDSDKSGLQKQS